MKLQKTPIALAACSLVAAAPAFAAPTISFTSPQEGAVFSKVATGTCSTSTSGATKVEFSLVSGGTVKPVKIDSAAPFDCSFNPYHYVDGTWTLRAVAYDSSGATATATRTIVINNNGTATSGGSSGSSGGSGSDAPANSAPVVSFSKPANNTTVPVGGSVSCLVSASDADGIAKVEWLLDGKLINTEYGSPYDTCNVYNLAAGTHTITARATDNKGAVGQASVTVVAGSASSGAPVVSFSKPANNSVIQPGQSVSCLVNASDPDGIAKLEWLLDGKLINTEYGSPYDTCNVGGLTSGTHTITARATDKKGAVGEAKVTISVASSGGSDSPGGGGSGSVNPADIKTRATADLLFSSQPNIYTDVLGSSPWLSTIPESGKHGSVLPNGETLRFGKEIDPKNSSRKALSFQLAPSDPKTGGSKRVELGFPRNIEYNKTYWFTVSVYVHDWGTLPSTDQGLFGFQLHNGTKIDLSPTIALYAVGNGRQMQIQTRYSTVRGTPSQSTTVTQKWSAMPIPFGRWMDFVVKFRTNVQGNGFAQVWLDGNLIVDHKGNLGFDTPGYLDFMKVGYYNWTTFNTVRKVRLRNPTLVLDPTGSKYSASDIRSILTGTSGTTLAAQ